MCKTVTVTGRTVRLKDLIITKDHSKRVKRETGDKGVEDMQQISLYYNRHQTNVTNGTSKIIKNC